ncbi:hypothetical protein AB0L41_16500 [Amycolatopsis mediterranei]|uniref:hypothetical protein n=1 Tax=Amycolatopsis mediterranei TaxID=33910 RepID=UPI003441CCAB
MPRVHPTGRRRDRPRLEVASDTLGVAIRETWNAEPPEDTAGLLRGYGRRVGFRALGGCALSLGTPPGAEFATPVTTSPTA